MLIAYLSGWLVPPVITIFALFFPTADFTLRSMKLRKKNEENVSNYFTTRVESRTICHTCRRAFRVKVTIIWGSIYFLLLFFFVFFRGNSSSISHSVRISSLDCDFDSSKKRKKAPPTLFSSSFVSVDACRDRTRAHENETSL